MSHLMPSGEFGLAYNVLDRQRHLRRRELRADIPEELASYEKISCAISQIASVKNLDEVCVAFIAQQNQLQVP